MTGWVTTSRSNHGTATTRYRRVGHRMYSRLETFHTVMRRRHVNRLRHRAYRIGGILSLTASLDDERGNDVELSALRNQSTFGCVAAMFDEVASIS